MPFLVCAMFHGDRGLERPSGDPRQMAPFRFPPLLIVEPIGTVVSYELIRF